MKCPVCAIPLGYFELCPSPACPRYGLRAGAPRDTPRPSVAAARAMSGSTALDILDRDAWLQLARAYDDVLAVEIEHEVAP